MERLAEQFLWDESGLETVEYSILAALIVVGVVGLIAAIGVWVAGVYSGVKSGIGA